MESSGEPGLNFDALGCGHGKGGIYDERVGICFLISTRRLVDACGALTCELDVALIGELVMV